jgi:hypothetical protein
MKRMIHTSLNKQLHILSIRGKNGNIEMIHNITIRNSSDLIIMEVVKMMKKERTICLNRNLLMHTLMSLIMNIMCKRITMN